MIPGTSNTQVMLWFSKTEVTDLSSKCVLQLGTKIVIDDAVDLYEITTLYITTDNTIQLTNTDGNKDCSVTLHYAGVVPSK